VRVAVIGGTGFIGLRVVECLVARGDQLLIVHCGRTSPTRYPACAHDAALPPDLRLTRETVQHLFVTSDKARKLLNWQPEDAAAPVARPVR
jgi:NAD(P)-dependent dehydrogenase (short-subunit alcohol dehydrogenase family)